MSTLSICAVSLIAATLLLTACGSNGSPGAEETSPTTTTDTRETGAPHLVGRWKRVNKCPELVNALNDADLAKIAPSVAGDYFRETPPTQLAQKEDICQGAKPIVHYHFFTDAGQFGSLDENEEQVDDGTYEIIDDRTFVISKEFPDTTFHFEIKGDAMTLLPVVTQAMKKEALANPLEFSQAGWAISVSYQGHEWERVDCAGWC